MNKVDEFEALTATYAFSLEVQEHAGTSDYIGVITGHTPKIPVEADPFEVGPQSLGPPMEFIEAEEYRDQDKDKLISKCKKRMAELGGEIIVFDSLFGHLQDG